MAFSIKSIPTKPIGGQKTGMSGLRKKVKAFMQENFRANWIQVIIKITAGTGIGKFWLAREYLSCELLLIL
ncbi:hypothetical protein F0562_031315 [Nyssa sinensis]|uniref:Uncharacterized protein n=1 Tax=Nyssa sinensis TaxID=561372 RepID=A0A5J5ATW5_9ASTE|nr:hypothetical protein F0562_031315 [Nyssa sinensis]